MNFGRIFIFMTLALLVLSVPTEGRSRWKRFWKGVERVGQNTRDASLQVLELGAKAGAVQAALSAGTAQ